MKYEFYCTGCNSAGSIETNSKLEDWMRAAASCSCGGEIKWRHPSDLQVTLEYAAGNLNSALAALEKAWVSTFNHPNQKIAQMSRDKIWPAREQILKHEYQIKRIVRRLVHEARGKTPRKAANRKS